MKTRIGVLEKAQYTVELDYDEKQDGSTGITLGNGRSLAWASAGRTLQETLSALL